MESAAFISVQNLIKRFNNNLILEGINLEIAEGECCALLGKNGSGKSTFINCLLDLIKIDEGVIKINGLTHKSNRNQIKKIIGVVSEVNPLIHEFTGLQYLEFVGILHGIKNEVLKKRMQNILSFFLGDNEALSGSISGYSTGIKQKLSICAALLHKPKLLILDEPFTGLDFFASNKVIKFLQFYLNNGNTVFIASHDLDYVQEIANRIIVLDNKKIVFNDTINFFTSNGSKIIKDVLSDLLNPIEDHASDLNWE